MIDRLRSNSTNLWAKGLMAAAIGVLAGCAGGGVGDGSGFLQLSLQATQENAGAVGQVSLVDQGDETALNFFISGVPLWTSRPVNLLTYIYPGSCTALADKPEFSMNNTTQTAQVDGGWRFSKTVPVDLDSLREGGYSIVLRSTPADHSINIFCVPIK